jgi:hypothetical protein
MTIPASVMEAIEEHVEAAVSDAVDDALRDAASMARGIGGADDARMNPVAAEIALAIERLRADRKRPRFYRVGEE